MVFDVEDRTDQRVLAVEVPVSVQTGFPLVRIVPELPFRHLVLRAAAKEVFACFDACTGLGAKHHAHSCACVVDGVLRVGVRLDAEGSFDLRLACDGNIWEGNWAAEILSLLQLPLEDDGGAAVLALEKGECVLLEATPADFITTNLALVLGMVYE